MSAWHDNNLYFHQRSFLSDDSVALYESHPAGGYVLMGYICATGERIRISTPRGEAYLATAARSGNRVFARRAGDIVELTITLRVSVDPAVSPSQAACTERVVRTLPSGIAPDCYLTENANGRLVAFGTSLQGGDEGLATVDTRTGAVKVICRIPHKLYAAHVQFSHVSPYLLSFAGTPRINVVDVRTGRWWTPYHELPGELVTHESWWVKDQIVFCGGHRKNESHVKVLDPYTGEVRVVGTGAWWPQATPSELAKVNWWHANGHDSGQWVAADNWHGDIVVFDGLTTRAVLVTSGHRTYGHGEHPHVGWDRSGARVIFTSNMFGGQHVCIAEIPAVSVQK
jgi:hypothetical protein